MMMQVTRALGHGDAHGAVDQLAHLPRVGRHVDVVAGDILVQRHQIDFLLVVAAERQAVLLPDDRQHRLMVGLRVVKAVQQMDRARPGGREADPEFAGEFGVRAGHERGQLLMPRLDELDLVAGPGERPDQAVDAVAGVAENPLAHPIPTAVSRRNR